jgi:cytochrome c
MSLVMVNLLFRLSLVAGLLFGVSAAAGQTGTPDEARALAQQAAEFLRQHGPDKAFPMFNAKDGVFQERDLYVVVYDTTGRNVSRGGDPASIGKNLIDPQDSDARSMIHDLVMTRTQEWVDYKWSNPVNMELEAKTTYVVRVGHYLVGVDVHRQ